MADHSDWMQQMDSGVGEPLPTSPGVDTGGHGDWFDAMNQGVESAPPEHTDINPDPGHNPVVDPANWNIVSSLTHGMSLGADMPMAIELLARKEAETFRANGADDQFIAKMMPQWRAMAKAGLEQGQAEYAKLAPGANMTAQMAGSTIPTALGTGALIGALAKGLSAVGLDGAARFISGTAGRAALPPGSPAGEEATQALVQGLSRATRGMEEGAIGGAAQKPFAPDKSVAQLAREGATLGLGMEAMGPWVRAGGNRLFGIEPAAIPRIQQRLSDEYGNIASQAGVYGRSVDPNTGRVTAQMLDRSLTGVPNEAAHRVRLADVSTRERGLQATAEAAASHAHSNKLTHALGYPLTLGAGVGLSSGLAEPLIEILKNPSAWGPIMAGVAATGAVSAGRKMLIHNSVYRNMLLRAKAAGLTPAEYLGIGNPAIAAGNALMQYRGPKMEAQR